MHASSTMHHYNRALPVELRYPFYGLTSARLSNAPDTYKVLTLDSKDPGTNTRKVDVLTTINDGLPSTVDRLCATFNKDIDIVRDLSVFVEETERKTKVKANVDGSIIVLAGLYGFGNLFSHAVGRMNMHDFLPIIQQFGRPFFSFHTLATAVQNSARATVSARSLLDRNGDQIRNTHQLIPLYLSGVSEESFDLVVPALFGRVMATDLHGDSRFAGALVGICVAGLLRYGKNARRKQEKQKEFRQYFNSAIRIAANAIGASGFPWALVLKDLMNSVANPLSDDIFGTDEQVKDGLRQLEIEVQCIMALGADTREAILTSTAGTADEKEQFVSTITQTVRRCGLVF